MLRSRVLYLHVVYWTLPMLCLSFACTFFCFGAKNDFSQTKRPILQSLSKDITVHIAMLGPFGVDVVLSQLYRPAPLYSSTGVGEMLRALPHESTWVIENLKPLVTTTAPSETF